jgi:hypothetical protein
VTTEAFVDSPADIGTVRTEIGVGIADLRQALRSVAVHASPDKEDPILQRVRLHITRGNVLVAATNRYTVAVAAVSIWHNAYDDDGVVVDLTAAQVPEILAMFRSKGEKSDDEGDDDLRIRITDRYLVMTDVAGLFPGKEVTWPRVATEEQFPERVLPDGWDAHARRHRPGEHPAHLREAARPCSRPPPTRTTSPSSSSRRRATAAPSSYRWGSRSSAPSCRSSRPTNSSPTTPRGATPGTPA